MTKKYGLKVHKAFNLLLCISIFAAGICLICGCLNIYFTGERIYSREIVSNVFNRIAIPVYICLAFTIISFVWEFISATDKSKVEVTKDFPALISKLSAKKDFSDSETVAMIKKERHLRKVHIAIRSCIIIAASIVFLTYALNSNNFDNAEINASVVKAMWILIPCLTVMFAYSVFTSYFCIKSFEREFTLIRQLPSATASNEHSDNVQRTSKAQLIIRISLILMALTIIIYGYLTGGTSDVLTKAINICTECIGLG